MFPYSETLGMKARIFNSDEDRANSVLDDEDRATIAAMKEAPSIGRAKALHDMAAAVYSAFITADALGLDLDLALNRLHKDSVDENYTAEYGDLV